MALQLPGVLPSELLGRRPDIVAARWRVEAADKQIKVARTKFYPSFNLTALAGVVAPNVGDLLKSSSTFAYIGPALSLPIFEGGKLRAKLEIRVATLFKTGPAEFLKMITVHELAHLKEKDHNKAFYNMCLRMEPHYHQYEFDLRLYLTHLEATRETLWEAKG
ncbi:hypothetical protein G6F24_015669 [Rhizopus arrhizus]|nr:hypothetical protein G6F24_015669 [Rhizopus arrhizus]